MYSTNVLVVIVNPNKKNCICPKGAIDGLYTYISNYKLISYLNKYCI